MVTGIVWTERTKRSVLSKLAYRIDPIWIAVGKYRIFQKVQPEEVVPLCERSLHPEEVGLRRRQRLSRPGERPADGIR